MHAFAADRAALPYVLSGRPFRPEGCCPYSTTRVPEQENMEGIVEGSSEATGKLSVLQLSGSTSFVRSEDSEITAICKNCKSVLKDTGCKHGTKNTLKRHSDGCWREDDGPPAKQQRPAPPAPFPEGYSSAPQAQPRPAWFNQEECAAELVRMIAFHGYPSSIVDDECFRRFLRGLNPFFQMPPRPAVEGICHSRAEEAMTQLKETLARCPGKVSLATGISDTGGEGRALYMACQFVDEEWVFQKRIMQVFKVVCFPPYNHSALLGAEEVCLDVPQEVLGQQFSLPRISVVLEEAVRRWGLLPGRIFSVAWCQELQDHRRLRRHGFLDQVVPIITYTSDALDSIAALIHKALDGSYEVACLRGLQLSHEELARRFSELALNHVGRYDKRWYSYYCALEVLHQEHSEHHPALELEEEEQGPADFSESQLTEMLSEIRVSRERSPMLRDSRITRKPSRRHRESLFTDLLRKIFGTIYRAIEAISSPGCAAASICLWELKKVRDVVQSEAMDACRNVPKAIAYAQGGFGAGEDANVVLLEAQGKLDKFLEDSFVYLSIPAVLDPRFKLDGVRSFFSEVFDDSAAAPANFSIVGKKIEDMFREYSEGGMTEGASSAAMSVDGASQQSTAMDELERYLEDGVVVHGGEAAGGGFDVLQWWKENKVRYPTVARMARDALAMPASDLLSPQHLSRVRSMARSYCVTYPSNTYTTSPSYHGSRLK